MKIKADQCSVEQPLEESSEPKNEISWQEFSQLLQAINLGDVSKADLITKIISLIEQNFEPEDTDFNQYFEHEYDDGEFNYYVRAKMIGTDSRKEGDYFNPPTAECSVDTVEILEAYVSLSEDVHQEFDKSDELYSISDLPVNLTDEVQKEIEYELPFEF